MIHFFLYFLLYFLLFSSSDILLTNLFHFHSSYFLIFTMQNIFIGMNTFSNVKRIFCCIESVSEDLEHSVLPVVYAFPFYQSLFYHETMPMVEKVYHFVSLAIMFPFICQNFDDNDLVGYFFFTNVGSIVQSMSLFLYENDIVFRNKQHVMYLNFLCNTYLYFPILISYGTFLLQYFVFRYDTITTTSPAQIYSGVFLILLSFTKYVLLL